MTNLSNCFDSSEQVQSHVFITLNVHDGKSYALKLARHWPFENTDFSLMKIKQHEKILRAPCVREARFCPSRQCWREWYMGQENAMGGSSLMIVNLKSWATSITYFVDGLSSKT
ncbi:hypothetical protein BDDG_12906 [Blastomyces dermatitidis ATCC 18188]|uniref:Uncharacterized protein n=1 Tax=Ajellomyces dermatitidis (strain ATCC 18188 / CBS 674.68) TaxID=653446 RepID=A0A0J9ETV5_AJEDA|nr:hypothetical protein BDDG_12906 [Blastomyces dermatitidis ATCC 18188]